ncbi:MAG TPA: BREX-2 system phosphatase PglZ, partial [Pirellulales bacterium]
MNSATPTFSQIKARVESIRRKVDKVRPIGIHTAGRWIGDNKKSDGDQTYLIYQCDSPLAMRLALRERTESGATKVLLTTLDESDLSQDILLRLTKRQLFSINRWDIVRSFFQAREIDPRLIQHPWIADALLKLFPARDYPPARGGFVDADMVWSLLLQRTIGLAAENPDATAILKWSIDADAVRRFQQAADVFRDGAAAWLAEKAGPVAKVILRCVARSETPDALPLGLALGVVYHASAAGRLERAAGKLEQRYLGGDTPDRVVVERWSAAAGEVVRLQLTDNKVQHQQLARADEILREVQAEGFAYLGNTSPLGFDQRLARLGSQLAEIMEGSGRVGNARPTADFKALRQSREQIREHALAGEEDQRRRLQRVEMAMRLVRWLGQRRQEGPAKAGSFAEAAAGQLREGGFVDWARLVLRSGDPVPELSRAFARLFDEVTKIREEQSREFAVLLRDWTAAGSTGDDIIPVERVLEQVVAPLAAKNPVLVIVIDGMSVAVCRELLADVTRHEWFAACEPGRTLNRPAIATIPSVTEFSRTSLLSGRLRQGSAQDERPGFAEHPELLARCRPGYPPILFHKVSLQQTEDAVLAAEVRDAIGSSHRKVVGVVVNAVDDHLLKGEQIDTRWTRDEIKVLPSLLHEAANAHRIVILLSDHGHVLDCQMEGQAAEGGERWRVDDGKPSPRELRIEGARVGVEGRRLIAPWTEKVRFGVKKNGYHGGLNPQEMVVPIAVLTTSTDFPDGWTEMP